MGQSSNDCIPTAIHVSAVLAARHQLLPALEQLATLSATRKEVGNVLKTGRTHLMDAMPVTFGQELRAWRTQIEKGLERIARVEPRLFALAQGGTAVGTGINAHPEFSARFFEELARVTDSVPAQLQPVRSTGHAGHRGRAVRSAQDRCGKPHEDCERPAVDEQRSAGRTRELRLPALQPGSSIMPGKVNPGDSRSHRNGCRGSHGKRRDHRHCRPVGKFPAQCHVAADRIQAARAFACSRTAAGTRAAMCDRLNPTRHASMMRWRAIRSWRPRSIRSSVTRRPPRSPSTPTPKGGRCSTWRSKCRDSRKPSCVDCSIRPR